jgi:Zn finger protein HypA/HybF involved in hydrogenase expression
MKHTTKDFIEKSINKHGNEYDYSLVEYVNIKQKVKIICKKHGIFEQTPYGHLNSDVCCPQCRKKPLTNVISDFKKIHGDKYDYSLMNYIDCKSKIKIICKIHGVFEQTPINHISGKGCYLCSKTKKLSLNEFINKSKQIHGDKYDYSLVNYKNNNTKVQIICKIHGVFEQTPMKHLRGQQCPKCSGKYKTTKELVTSFKKIHGNKYDYSMVNYINAATKVKIICEKHGVFEQIIGNHLNGYGCSKCNNSRGEIQIENYLKNKNIMFESQKKFKGCKNKYQLPFDFFIPSLNICIEYDGIQHFKPLKHFGGNEKFIYRQNNDDIKNKFCQKNNINLLRIKYNEDIIEKLNNILC